MFVNDYIVCAWYGVCDYIHDYKSTYTCWYIFLILKTVKEKFTVMMMMKIPRW